METGVVTDQRISTLPQNLHLVVKRSLQPFSSNIHATKKSISLFGPQGRRGLDQLRNATNALPWNGSAPPSRESGSRVSLDHSLRTQRTYDRLSRKVRIVLASLSPAPCEIFWPWQKVMCWWKRGQREGKGENVNSFTQIHVNRTMLLAEVPMRKRALRKTRESGPVWLTSLCGFRQGVVSQTSICSMVSPKMCKLPTELLVVANTPHSKEVNLPYATLDAWFRERERERERPLLYMPTSSGFQGFYWFT